MNLSLNFTLAELTITDHREFDNTPDEKSLENLKRLAIFLEEVKTLLNGRAVMITSGYRSAPVNAAVGSKEKSQHRVGCAADFRIPGITPDEIVRRIVTSDLKYDQVIREFDTWTHISIPTIEWTTPRLNALIIDRTGTRPFV
jgi:zinc D-Ala-D-Ala carboxypeptidase